MGKEDLDRLVEATKLHLKMWAEPIKSKIAELHPLTQKLKNASDDEIAKHVLKVGSHAWHPAATCAIGKVVNEKCQVLGVERLRVCDLAALPNLSSGNTMIPAFLFGANAGEIIA